MPRKISREYLRSILDYDLESGVFIWKISKGNKVLGSTAGYTCNKYIFITIDGNNYAAHRLAFLFMTGEIPNLIDHIDRDESNNRWSNLRPANKKFNAANSKKRSDNSSGYKGVSYRSDLRRGKKWRASIYKDGRQFCIGTYYSKIEAAIAYDQEALKFFGEFAVTNKSLGLL